MKKLLLIALVVLASRTASAAIVYQTVEDPAGPFYASSNRGAFTQIMGNASQEYGDEIELSPAVPTVINNIRVGTQTFFNSGTLAYTPAYLLLRVYANDGPPSADGNVPDGRPQPGTLLGSSLIDNINRPDALRVKYPAGGIHFSTPALYVDFPLPNVLVPAQFTFTYIALDDNMNIDNTWGLEYDHPGKPAHPVGSQQPSQRWGPWLDNGLTSNAPGGVKTNDVGTSKTFARTGFTNTGMSIWIKYNGGWIDDRNTNYIPEAIVFSVPEPAGIALAAMGMAGLIAVARRRRKAKPAARGGMPRIYREFQKACEPCGSLAFFTPSIAAGAGALRPC